MGGGRSWRLKMNKREPILANHKKNKSKLITPFNAAFSLHEMSWVNTMIPELLWIALIQEKYGLERGVEIVTSFTRDIRASEPSRNGVIWAAAGKYASICRGELRAIVQANGEAYTNELHTALLPLATWYPSCPLSALFPDDLPVAHPEGLAHLKAVVANLFERSAQEAVFVQAIAIWIAFDSGRFKVAPHLALADFPQIEKYPNTERSKKIAGSIRATLNVMFGDTELLASGTDWPITFWNRGIEIDPCENR